MKGFYRKVACVMIGFLMVSHAGPACAVGKDWLMSRKFHGALLMGMSGFLIKEAIDAKSQANDAYSLYKTAASPQAAQSFYDESKRHDTRSAVFSVLGVGSVLYSLHLFMRTGEDDLPPPKMDGDLVRFHGLGLDVGGDVLRGQLQFRVRKGF